MSANTILQAQRSDRMVAALHGSGAVDPYTYKAGAVSVVHGKEDLSLEPTTVPAWGVKTLFRLPRYAIMGRCLFRIQVGALPGADAGRRLGDYGLLQMIDTIRMLSPDGREIQRLTGATLFSIIESQSTDAGRQVRRYLAGNAPQATREAAAAGSQEFLLELPLWSSISSRLNLDLTAYAGT